MPSAIFDPASYAFNAYAIPTLATAGAMLVFGVLVLVRERGSRVAVQFSLLAGAISIWLTCFSIMYLSAGEGVALVWARSAYLGIGFIPAALYGFAVAVTRGPHRRLARAGWLISAGFTLVMLTTGALVRDLYRYWWGYYPRFRWLGVPFLVFFFTMLALSLREYWHDYRTAGPVTHRRRTRLLMTAFAIAYLGSFDYVGAYGVPLYPFGYAPVLVFIAIAAYTIRRYRLVDLTPAFAAEQILATVADPVIVCDLAGTIRFTNEAASTVFGYAPGELAGAPIERLAEPRVGSTVRLHLAGGEVVRDAEMVFRTRQGEAVEVGVSLSPLTDGQGQAVGAVLLARDVRARKRAEEALRKSEESYRTLFERNQAGVFRNAADGTILDCNDAFARILGYASRSECIGRSMAQHYADSGQRPRFLEILRAHGVLSRPPAARGRQPLGAAAQSARPGVHGPVDAERHGPRSRLPGAGDHRERRHAQRRADDRGPVGASRDGVRISIDDFGTGHASLAYLKQFPIDALKIDRSFVADMEASREGLAIVTAITGLAHGLGLGVIAEGVESDSQLRLLAACGCDEYQGYLLSRPLPPATVRGFLDRSRRSTAVPLSRQPPPPPTPLSPTPPPA